VVCDVLISEKLATSTIFFLLAKSIEIYKGRVLFKISLETKKQKKVEEVFL